METYQIVYRGRNYMRVAISGEFGPYAVYECFATLASLWKECGTVGILFPEAFETTTETFKNSFKLYRVEGE